MVSQPKLDELLDRMSSIKVRKPRSPNLVGVACCRCGAKIALTKAIAGQYTCGKCG